MKTSLVYFFFFLWTSLGCYGQKKDGMPIPILTNEHTTTTIFFPSGIAKTIEPAENFRFEYQDDDTSLGFLQGKKGNPGNLTVITDNGYIYSFALQYAENMEVFNFILTTDMAVGRIPNRGARAETEEDDELLKDDDTYQEAERGYVGFSDGDDDLYNIDREEYYRIFCENNYLQKTVFKRTFRQNKRIVLKLNNILIDQNEIYFVLQVENNSKKEYEVNGLSFFRKTGLGQLQKIIKPLFTFNLQEKIDPQSINEVVFVFKRFTISNKEEVYVVLDELETNRMVMLPLDNKQINAPTH